MRLFTLHAAALVVMLVGCGSHEGLDSNPDVQAASTEVVVGAAQQAPQAPTTTSSKSLGKPSDDGDNATVDDHNGQWCTYNCSTGCFQDRFVTWGHCADRASDLGCWNARWCNPRQCCR